MWNGLITNEKTIARDPDLVRRMTSAFLKGLADAMANPDEAYQISTKYVQNLALDKTTQKKILAAPSNCGRPRNWAIRTIRPGRTCSSRC